MSTVRSGFGRRSTTENDGRRTLRTRGGSHLRRLSVGTLRGGRLERSVYFARLSVPVDVTMASWKILLAVQATSFVLLVYGAFSVGIASSKILAVRHHDRTGAFAAKNANPDIVGVDCADSDTVESDALRRTFRRIGAIVIALSTIFVATSAYNFFSSSPTQQYDKWVAIAIATVAFVELIGSVMGAHSARKNDEPVMESLKLVNLAGCCALLVMTQTALLSFTYEGDTTKYNALAGIVFGLIAAALGVRVYTRRATTAL